MKKTLHILIILIIIFLIISCATPYKQSSFLGGYESYQNSENSYSLYFRGNGYTSSQTVWLFFLTRAAEIAIKENYKYFYVINSSDFSREYQYTTPGTTQSKSTGIISGNLITINTHAYTTPPITHNVKKAAFSGTILLVDEPVEGYPNVYDAKKIYEVGMKKNKNILKYNITISSLTLLSCLLPFTFMF